jgi:hypothetical protein
MRIWVRLEKTKEAERMRRITLIGALLALALGVAAPLAGARVIPERQLLYGARYDGWLVNWSTAAVHRSLQAETSLVAVRGNKCGLDTGKVWFLPVSINGLLHVHCEIPRGHHVVVFVGGAPGWAKNPDALRSWVNRGFGWFVSYSLTVDGRSLQAPVVRTPVFVTEIPQANWLGLPPGSYDFYVKARMVILSPLRPGEHTISTVANYSDPVDDFTNGFTYHLMVR